MRHFISSVGSRFSSCASSVSLIRLVVPVSWPDSKFSSSLSSAKDTVHEILDGLRWLDEDRASGLHNLGLSEMEMVVGCEGACCQPFCSTVNTHFSLFLVFQFTSYTLSSHLMFIAKLKT